MEVAGEVALEASHGFALGLAFSDAPRDVGLGVRVLAHANHDDGVDGVSNPASRTPPRPMSHQPGSPDIQSGGVHNGV